MDYKSSGGHRVLEIRGKGGKERRVPLHPEAFERLDQWIDLVGVRDGEVGALFRPPRTARGKGFDGFRNTALMRRAVQYLATRYSFRVTALTTARERRADNVDLQDFAGHSDPRTTLAYIRNRNRLSRSSAYVLRYDRSFGHRQCHVLPNRFQLKSFTTWFDYQAFRGTRQHFPIRTQIVWIVDSVASH